MRFAASGADEEGARVEEDGTVEEDDGVVMAATTAVWTVEAVTKRRAESERIEVEEVRIPDTTTILQDCCSLKSMGGWVRVWRGATQCSQTTRTMLLIVVNVRIVERHGRRQ